MGIFSALAPYAAPVLGGLISADSSKSNTKKQIKWDKERYGLDNQRIAENYAFQTDQLMLGNELDMSNQKEMFDYRINQGREAGMTDYEMFMGPAAGAGGGTSNSGATLGNAANQQQISRQQLEVQMRENERNRQVELDKANLGAMSSIISSLGSAALSSSATKTAAETSAGASVQSSEISAAASRYQTDIRDAMERDKLNLSERQYQQMLLPAAQQQLKLSKAQTEKTLNEIATSDPEFVKKMKKWSMGVDNMMTQYFADTFGVDITDPDSIRKIPENVRKQFLAAVMGFQSNIAKEGAGIKGLDVMQGMGSILGNVYGAGNEVIKDVTGKMGSMFKGNKAKVNQPNRYNKRFK